jgi:hypothetical protein
MTHRVTISAVHSGGLVFDVDDEASPLSACSEDIRIWNVTQLQP